MIRHPSTPGSGRTTRAADAGRREDEPATTRGRGLGGERGRHAEDATVAVEAAAHDQLVRMPRTGDRALLRGYRESLHRALARHGRSQKKQALTDRKWPGPAPYDIPNKAIVHVGALLESGARMSFEEIEAQTGVDRHDIDKIRAWRNGRGYEIHPGSIPGTSIFRKTRK